MLHPQICGFCLQYENSSKRWVFVMPTTDASPPAGYTFVRSKEPAVQGVWTHLTGVYDTHEVKLTGGTIFVQCADLRATWDSPIT